MSRERVELVRRFLWAFERDYARVSSPSDEEAHSSSCLMRPRPAPAVVRGEDAERLSVTAASAGARSAAVAMDRA
jgi:hypothetical protein